MEKPSSWKTHRTYVLIIFAVLVIPFGFLLYAMVHFDDDKIPGTPEYEESIKLYGN